MARRQPRSKANRIGTDVADGPLGNGWEGLIVSAIEYVRHLAISSTSM